MSSSFPAARFPALPLRKDRGATDPLYRDTVAPNEEPSDENLIAQMCTDDTEALGILFRRYARLVHSIGKRILRDPAEAEDFVQELFLHLFRKAHLYDASRGPARGWIVQTSYYEALHRRAHLSTRPHYGSTEFDELEASDIAAPPIAGYDRSGEGLFGRARWRELVECLTEEQWETFRLHFYEGYTFDEISQMKNQTVVSVRHHFYRGLDRLRKHIFASELRYR
ncbi:MAG: sigma-70 family RNA polymerase sigma factor [Halobacteriota archaeon]|jgi:RNA polymerase sigma-70 factor (ECF subfamily)